MDYPGHSNPLWQSLVGVCPILTLFFNGVSRIYDAKERPGKLEVAVDGDGFNPVDQNFVPLRITLFKKIPLVNLNIYRLNPILAKIARFFGESWI